MKFVLNRSDSREGSIDKLHMLEDFISWGLSIYDFEKFWVLDVQLPWIATYYRTWDKDVSHLLTLWITSGKRGLYHICDANLVDGRWIDQAGLHSSRIHTIVSSRLVWVRENWRVDESIIGIKRCTKYKLAERRVQRQLFALEWKTLSDSKPIFFVFCCLPDRNDE